MNKIEVGLVNFGDTAMTNRRLMSLAANVSMKGHKVDSFQSMIDQGFFLDPDDDRISRLANLPHPTLQKFMNITVLFTGVSRRFLAKITRHQNEIKFMASSFKYGDHSTFADFCMPIEIIRAGADVQKQFNDTNLIALDSYQELVKEVGQDAAGYMLPNATRCTILASATPFQWKHMIRQRVCNRNSPEMQYTMLKLWDLLYGIDPIVFHPDTTGPLCMSDGCKEGGMRCATPPANTFTPREMLRAYYPECIADEGKVYDQAIKEDEQVVCEDTFTG